MEKLQTDFTQFEPRTNPPHPRTDITPRPPQKKKGATLTKKRNEELNCENRIGGECRSKDHLIVYKKKRQALCPLPSLPPLPAACNDGVFSPCKYQNGLTEGLRCVWLRCHMKTNKENKQTKVKTRGRQTHVGGGKRGGKSVYFVTTTLDDDLSNPRTPS